MTEVLGYVQRDAMGFIVRRMIVLLTGAAWIVLFNHCALGLSGLMPVSVSEQAGCPMHSAPDKEKPATHIPCCKELRGVVTQAMKLGAPFTKQVLGEQEYVTAVFVFPPPPSLSRVSLDTGPPTSFSFAETILQRSILIHAPPVTTCRV